MRRATMICLWTLRLAGATQLVLGGLLWFAPRAAYVPFHLGVGMLVVLSVLLLAAVALRAGVRWPLPTLTIVWVLGLVAFAFPHVRLLPGPLHWIVRLVHLSMGVIAIGLGHRVAAWTGTGGSIAPRVKGPLD